jgi:hypothetical protein
MRPASGTNVPFGELFRELLLRHRSPRALAAFFRSEIHAAKIRAHKEAYERAEAAAPETIEVDPRWPSIPTAFDLIVDYREGIRIKLRRPRPKTEYDELLCLVFQLRKLSWSLTPTRACGLD